MKSPCSTHRGASRAASTSAELAERLICAKRSIAFVQAKVLAANVDDAPANERWRRHLQQYGVWANAAVSLFPVPGSLDYTAKWGLPDEQA